MSRELTLRQAEALCDLKKHGRLVRLPGGYWTSPAEAQETRARGTRTPRWSYGTNTVMGLVDKGYAVGQEHMSRGDPAAVVPIPEGADATAGEPQEPPDHRA